jgi:hypothetical protein
VRSRSAEFTVLPAASPGQSIAVFCQLDQPKVGAQQDGEFSLRQAAARLWQKGIAKKSQAKTIEYILRKYRKICV